MTDYVTERLNATIRRNRAALLRIVWGLFMRAGLDEGGAEALPFRSWRAILLVLGPAESAVRRLIVIAARDIAVALRRRTPHSAPKFRPSLCGDAREDQVAQSEQQVSQAEQQGAQAEQQNAQISEDIDRFIAQATTGTSVSFAPDRKRLPRTGVFWQGLPVRPGETPWLENPAPAGASRAPDFALADAARRYGFEPRRACPGPRIRSLWGPAVQVEPAPEPLPDGCVAARGVCRRILALQAALDDIPGHAIRLARLGARRRYLAKNGTLVDALRPAPLRRGHPPGHRRRPSHPVDDILQECHDAAIEYARRDSS